MTERLERQIAFLMEIDRLKQVCRQTYLLDRSRHDNDAEHSWHFAVMALVLSEYACEKVDVSKVVRMALVHDIVEIDAGDLFVYDRKEAGSREAEAHQARERAAARRIFGLLPADQAGELIDLWEEFERRESPEARLAAAIDRLDPLLHNCYTDGLSWREHGVTAGRVLDVNGSRIGPVAPELWEAARALVVECVDKGYLKPDGQESPR